MPINNKSDNPNVADDKGVGDEAVAKAQAKKATYPNNPVADDVLAFYTGNYEVVQTVKCGNPDHGAILAIEVFDPQRRIPTHHDGYSLIDMKNGLMASRKRLDGQMGYQCICGYDTRMSEIEVGVIKSEAYPSDILPHEEAAVMAKIKTSNYKPDRVTRGKKTVLDKMFEVERIKG